MLFGRLCGFWSVALVTVLALPADGQSVISTRSGIVHFFEGSVSLDNQPLEPHPGRFPSVPPGAELHTADGRAEVLLTTNVFVRLGEKTGIRMLANELSDTRVELLSGSAVVDAAEPVSGQSVTLICKNWSVRFREEGVYRIDVDPPRLWVLQGKAEVSPGGKEQTLSVEQGMDLPFAAVLVPERFVEPPRDALSVWAEGRQQSISADNAIAANIQDPASMTLPDPGLDSFTYFPTLGLVATQPGLSSSYLLGSYQPGFNSLYLPGYTSLPLLFGVGSLAYPASLPYLRPHPLPAYHPIPSWHPAPTHPATSVGVPHAGAQLGMHAGGHH